MKPIVRAALLGGLSILGARAAIAADAQVGIDNFTFSPAEIDVPAGAGVVWTNRDDIPHAVTDAGNPRTLRSRPLDTGDTYRRVFPKAGVYRYFCSLHPKMQGTVVVR